MKVNQSITAQWFSNDQFGQRSHYMLINHIAGKTQFLLKLKTISVNMSALNHLKDSIIAKLFETQNMQQYIDVYNHEVKGDTVAQFFDGVVELDCPNLDTLKPSEQSIALQYMHDFLESFKRLARQDAQRIYQQAKQDFEHEVFGSSFSI